MFQFLVECTSVNTKSRNGVQSASYLCTSACFQLGGQNLPDLINPRGFYFCSWRLKRVDKKLRINCIMLTTVTWRQTSTRWFIDSRPTLYLDLSLFSILLLSRKSVKNLSRKKKVQQRFSVPEQYKPLLWSCTRFQTSCCLPLHSQ